MNPWELMPGVIFDSRSVLLSVGGLFLGWFPMVIAGSIASIYRVLIGGDGAFTGVAVIVSSCAIGVTWGLLRKRPSASLSGREYYLFGIVVHVNMLLWMLTLPSPTNVEVIQNLSLPIMLVLPLGTYFFASLLKAHSMQLEDNKRLKGSEERYRSLIDLARDAVVVYQDMKLVFVNQPASNLYDAPPGVELKGMPILDFVEPDFHEYAVERIQRMMASGQGEPLGRLKLRRYDGSNLMAEINSTPITFNDKPAILLSMRDISTQIRSEEELRKSGELLLETSQLARVGGWAIDLQGNTLQWTPETYRIHELPDEVLPDVATAIEFYHPDDRDMVGAVVAEGMESGTGFNFEARIITARNNLKWVRAVGNPVYEEDELVGLRGVVQDITDRRLAENSLKESENRYRALIEHAPFCIHEINLDGNIISMNQSGLKMLGLQTEDEVIGAAYLNSVAKDERDGVQKLMQRAFEGYESVFEFPGSNGTDIRHFSSCFVPIKSKDDRVERLMGITEDITERKLAESELVKHQYHLEELVSLRTEQLAESQQHAEDASRAKSAFLANMSHEIRTPMNAIIGLTHLLQQDEITDKQTDKLMKIDQAAAHLLAIINDILDISKIEAGKLVLEETDFSIDDTFENIGTLLKNQVLEKEIELKLETRGMREWWRGDATRLRQCLLNYAANAIKFTEQGRITLRARQLESNFEDVLVRFEVEDTGIGIAEDKLPTLFHAFEQADTSTTREYGGTGLGLAITERLAKLMGGQAGAHSKPGKGSLFWFTARLKPTEGPIDEIPADFDPSTRDFSGLRILLAEDNEINCEIAAELLNKVGIQPELANNGKQAVKMVSDRHYDLILMDVQMPELDGLEATRIIRAMKNDDDEATAGRSSIPIVAMTANVYEEDRKACLKAGMDDFLAKPVRPNQLYSMIDRWAELD